MARYTGPRCKLSRRADMPLGLKLRDESTKCDLDTPPGGRHLRARRLTDYGIRLREVQRLKWSYGILQRQLIRCYRAAEREPGDTGLRLLGMLERRLDNVAYRLRYAITLAQARQMVTHGHIRVNGTRVNVPSAAVQPGDVIEADAKMQPKIKEAFDQTKDRPVPSWLTHDETLRGKVVAEPSESDLPAVFDRRLIVEFLSR